MPDFENLKLGLLLFLHREKSCFTTISIYADKMRDLYKGPVFRKRLFRSEQCPGICLREEIQVHCTKPCECAWITVVLEKIKKWKKTNPKAAG